MDTKNHFMINNNINTNFDAIIHLKITFGNQIKSLFWWFVSIIVVVPGIYILYDMRLSDKNNVDLMMLMIWIMIFLIVVYVAFLAIFFHIEYLIRNRNEEYEIGDGRIIKYKNGIEKIYTYEDINMVLLYLTPSKYGSFMMYTRSHDNYHFAKIIMKSGEIIYLTSLLYPSGIEEILKKYMPYISYERRKRWLPTTLY
ncbi:hypothetical protein FACS1894178_8690 [Bacteroidia bacterium]|nr:hypothetical protein FACS1894178_8690 [Bacteroidia bacterium]